MRAASGISGQLPSDVLLPPKRGKHFPAPKRVLIAPTESRCRKTLRDARALVKNFAVSTGKERVVGRRTGSSNVEEKRYRNKHVLMRFLAVSLRPLCEFRRAQAKGHNRRCARPAARHFLTICFAGTGLLGTRDRRSI